VTGGVNGRWYGILNKSLTEASQGKEAKRYEELKETSKGNTLEGVLKYNGGYCQKKGGGK